MSNATVGSTPAKVIQTAVTTAKGSNAPLSGTPESMLKQQYNKHLVDPKSF
jgi:hypothetical protein